MKKKLIPIIFLVFVVFASADIRTSNVYYTEGASVNEDVFLHNLEYNNVVDINAAMITSSSNGVNSTGSESNTFSDAVIVHSAKDGASGAALSIAAKQLSFARSFYTGIAVPNEDDSISDNNNIKFSYGLVSGVEHASFFNKYTTVDERLISENNAYTANFVVEPNKVALKGYGSRFSSKDEDSKFDYNLRLSQMGLWADTNAYLKATRINNNDSTPVVYAWKVDVSSDGSKYAESLFNMSFIAGDRQVEAMITGSNSAGFITTVPITDSNGNPNPLGTPWTIAPLPDGSATPVDTIEDLINAVENGIAISGYMNFAIDP
jgi:hypothetical protein